MSKVRVYEVARQLGMKNKELVSLFQSLGFSEVRNHMSAVEADVVERVKRRLQRRNEPEVVEERIRPTVVKRRSRGERRRIAPSASSPGKSAPAAPASQAGRQAPPAEGSRRGAPPSARASAPASAAPASKKEVPAAAPSAPKAEPKAAEPPAPSEKAAEPAKAKGEAPAAKAAEPAKAEPKADAPKADAPKEPAAAAAKPEAKAAPEQPAPAKKAEAKLAPKQPAKQQPAARPQAPSKPAAAAKPAAKPASGTTGTTGRRRPTAPPKSGIEVWGGRPGVPMPQRPRTGTRRTTYDPRANVGGQRNFSRRNMAGRHMRPGFRGRNYRSQRKGPVEVSTKEMSARKMLIRIEGETTVTQLAQKMSKKATDVLMKLLSMGMTGVHINSTLDADTAKLLAEEFGWTVEDVSVDEKAELEAAMETETGDEGTKIIRPPIVTVMGHVDHGKTTLLDTIRKASVASGEAGGITQHIGAYRVETDKGTLCFLDTPGHAAFTSMRARGASVTDIVVLIVAADDGVMPQTKEAISHAKDAKVPIIVAINKMDKPGVDPERVIRELASEGLQAEDWGGDTIMCKVSAKNGDGIEHLLEMLLLQAEMLELAAYPDRRARGVVVEAMLDRGRGPVATVLVQDGTLDRGDVLLAGKAYGKIRAMVDEKGRKVKRAGPATPVEVLGLGGVPEAGDLVYSVKNLRAAETLAQERTKKARKSVGLQKSTVSLDDIAKHLAQGEQLELKVIVKADVQGSVEAIGQALTKLTTDRVKLTVVHTAVGGITETDINLAAAAGGIVVGFNVRPAGKARKSAESAGVEIRLYSVIYELIDDVRGAMEGLLPATKVEKELGRAEVRQVFRITKVGSIAGSMVTSGIIRRSAEVRLVRDSVVVWTGKLGSLKRFKDDAREVREGFECGIGLEGFNDVKDGDIIECFEIEEVKAKL